MRSVWPDVADFSSATVLAAVGPEGGFMDEEIGAAVTAGWTLVDLGPRILACRNGGHRLGSLGHLPLAAAQRFTVPLVGLPARLALTLAARNR